MRGRRRFLELAPRDPTVSEAQLIADLEARDARDAPNMIRAADAVVLDTTDLDRDSVLKAALAIIEEGRTYHRIE